MALIVNADIVSKYTYKLFGWLFNFTTAVLAFSVIEYFIL